MSPWIDYDTTLNGEFIVLSPLMPYHFEDLILLANDSRIWEHYVYDGTNPEKMQSTLDSALKDKENGTQFPFVIIDKATSRIVGSTRFMDIVSAHRKLEIGSTWLHPDHWAKVVNLEAKLLLLTHCFEHLKTLRVQLKTDERNIRSRKAIEKIGGVFEGILRNDMLRDNGTHRNSAYYSFIDTEWPAKKKALQELYDAKKTSLH
ncbi:GNAT family protein [Pollutibacter soli]|uniref:GNAT family N-acetyltransferase n=1 Tax=Pollutibacter soli TaxID=3034157 RepID=UPI0030139811